MEKKEKGEERRGTYVAAAEKVECILQELALSRYGPLY